MDSNQLQKTAVVERSTAPGEKPIQDQIGLWGAILGILVAFGLALAGLLISIGVSGVAGNTRSFWYLSRASGFVAYLLLWGSVVWGLLLSTKIARSRLRSVALLDAHQFLSNTALGFAFFHGLVLAGDRYVSIPLGAVLIPFASEYKPVLVAFGQIGLWLSLLLSLSFLVRKQIGNRRWRSFHYASFVAYAAALLHATWIGSDSGVAAVRVMYFVTAGTILALVAYRCSRAPARSDAARVGARPARRA